MRWPFLVLGVLAMSRVGAYEPPQPTHEVATLRETWHDARRDRDVPVKIYYPKVAGQHPVIIFSHGLGGSRDGYQYIGEWWAGCGYVVVHPQHAGSDDAVWRDVPMAERAGAMTRATLDPANSLNRTQDVSFVIDELTRRQRDAQSPLHGRLDLSRIGMSGHSYGGWTTMAVAGQSFGLRAMSLADPRVKAAIQMSAPAPRTLGKLRDPFAHITIPVLHLTGTRDDSPIGETKAEERRKLFDGMSTAPTGLLLFDGATHMTFSGRTKAGGEKTAADERFQRLIRDATTAFWDAWLRGDAGAKAWLTEGGLRKELAPTDVLEWKEPVTSSGSRGAD